MGVQSAANGSQSATLDTEHTLSTQTTAGVYVLAVDLNNLAGGDIVVLRLKTKCKTGSTSRLAFQNIYANIQTEKVVYSPAVPIDTEIVATLEQTDGTGRSFDWNLLKIG